MALIDNTEIIKQIETRLPDIFRYQQEELILEPFMRDFSLRFCWSSNAIEGNTLSLDETVAVIEYDEVRSGHSYSEYRDAKNLYRAVSQLMIPFHRKEIGEKWVRDANGFIQGTTGEYRTTKVYIGTLVEAVHYPPDPERVPELMGRFFEKWNSSYDGKYMDEIFELLAKEHIEFEEIHPFRDGNGRAGRMLLSQRMINLGLLPVAIEPSGNYRRAFSRYEKHGDISQMVHELAKAELAAMERMTELHRKANPIGSPVFNHHESSAISPDNDQ